MQQKHVIDKDWDLKKFITYIRENYRISWKEIFWKVWAQLKIMNCVTCDTYFHISDYNSCLYHNSKPIVKQSILNSFDTNYVFTCCPETVFVRDIIEQKKTLQSTGC